MTNISLMIRLGIFIIALGAGLAAYVQSTLPFEQGGPWVSLQAQQEERLHELQSKPKSQLIGTEILELKNLTK